MTEALVPWVNAGDKVSVDSCIINYLQSFGDGQDDLIYRVYSSEEPQIRFRTQPGVRKELDIVIDLPDDDPRIQRAADGTLERTVETKIYFGDTRIRVEAKNIQTEEEEEHHLNFEVL
jgi:hypothetical protein